MPVLILVLLAALLTACSSAKAEKTDRYSQLIKHNGQPFFMSGINLAWINFAHDLTRFDEEKFAKALEDVAFAGGNTIRWWIHVNGSQNPLWDGDRVTGMPEGSIEVLEHALDMAADRNVGLILCLWSFDMLQRQTGVDRARNKRFLESPALIKSYINNALIPIVEKLKNHPALIAWEVFNEPEGMLSAGGWTPTKVDMPTIQRAVNMIAGAIHLTDPFAKVTNGTVRASMITDIDGLVNYYSDEKLIAAGGDKRGTLDFYQFHYYPSQAGESMSPFHNPASHWQLDKPILIGEFPARGIRPIGKGFQPKTQLTTEEAYRYAFDNGYAGALAWTWTNHDGFGGVLDMADGTSVLRREHPDVIRMTQPSRDKKPVIGRDPGNIVLGKDEKSKEIDLKGLFTDNEDGDDLELTILDQTKKDLFKITVNGLKMTVELLADRSDVADVTIQAKDKAGNKAKMDVYVYSLGKASGNALLLKPGKSSSDEGPELRPAYVTDGRDTTRWSSAWVNDQYFTVDLQGVYELHSARLLWEVAYGKEYKLQVSMDGETWTDIFHEAASNGEEDLVEFAPVKARYFRMYGIKKATEWGFSLWEMGAEGKLVD
ncbi:MAG: discoidin domain-containing protein [Spirochaetales bacterium]|nr:discoidin domain-containing protein [Spirochaetales bacterium]